MKDEADAAGRFKLAADQNDGSAQFHCALCLEDGRAVVKNNAKAARYFKLAADQNDASSQNCYVICLATGGVVMKDESEAVQYHKLAVDQNCTYAQNDYAVCHAACVGKLVGLRDSATFIFNCRFARTVAGANRPNLSGGGAIWFTAADERDDQSWNLLSARPRGVLLH